MQAVGSFEEALELFTQRPAKEVLELARETLASFRRLSNQR